ncbi:hypothetical protein EfmAA290_18040 [Enterococcus faecium]|nr:hypothetical protein EfmAA290_18040 [Enterococcus faecium]
MNEHSNGLLRKDGLYKAMDFNGVSETFIQSVASKRNHIPRNCKLPPIYSPVTTSPITKPEKKASKNRSIH